MDLWCVHAKGNGFLLRNSFSEKPVCWSSKKAESVPSNCRFRSVSARAMAKRSSGNSCNSNPNSSSSNSGPLDASMFLLRAEETTGLAGFEEVIPGVYFGSRNSLDEASALIKKGKLLPHDFRFFTGYAGWQLDRLREEIESGYWHVAACSANLISLELQNSSSDNLWEEILWLMGGPTRS